MNRLLSLDGGGMRGFFTLEILERVEALLRERYKKPDLVLADYFNFIGGTSTGAIIAGLLSWGRSVEEIKDLYQRFGTAAFQSSNWWDSVRTKYLGNPVRARLRELFLEDDGQPALLGTGRLRTFFLAVLRNASTGSTWPVTNNPNATYNRRDRSHSNLDLPLWQLIRASTAAPTFFPSEIVTLIAASDGRERTFEFVDGGVTPHNNPSLLMYLYATLPQYHMNFAAGIDNLYLLSVGTGSLATVYAPGEMTRINRLGGALRVLEGLISAVNEQQDVMCRAIGRCLYGPPIDREIGDLVPKEAEMDAGERFLYCRYNYTFTDEERYRASSEFGSRDPLALDDLRSVPLLRELGAKYAATNVQQTHIPDVPLVTGRLSKF